MRGPLYTKLNQRLTQRVVWRSGLVMCAHLGNHGSCTAGDYTDHVLFSCKWSCAWLEDLVERPNHGHLSGRRRWAGIVDGTFNQIKGPFTN